MILREVFLESESPDENTSIEEAEVAEELTGKVGSDPDEERLAHSILENDEQTITDGKLLTQSVDYALNSFTPDLLFEQLVTNYRNAQRLFGPTIIKALTGYDGSFIEKNLRIKEFQEKLKENIHGNIDRLKKNGLLDDEGQITDEGLQLSALVLYAQELEHLKTKGLGRKETKDISHYGERDQRVAFRNHRYKDIDLRGSIMRAIRRGHKTILPEDLKATTRKQNGKISIVYAVDASGSMRGEKIHLSKRAGVALAYHAIHDGNDVGLVVFTSKVDKSIPPTTQFPLILSELVRIKAGQETDLANAIDHAIMLFDKGVKTKHLVMITDAIPTKGKEPGITTLEAVSRARDAGITISLVGINLEEEGEKLAKDIVEIGEGKMYQIKNLNNLDVIVLEDYQMLKRQG